MSREFSVTGRRWMGAGLILLGAQLLASCVAPGFQGPGGTVQGTASLEELERQAPVTRAPGDAANAANAVIYGSGPRAYQRRRPAPCGFGPCYPNPYH